MKKYIGLIFLIIPGTILLSQDTWDMVLQNMIVEMEQSSEFRGYDTITAAGDETTFIIEGDGEQGGAVLIEAKGTITLKPGFHAKTGSEFIARIDTSSEPGADLLADDTDVEKKQPENLPKEYALHQNFPNPFNPLTTIEYALPKDSPVQLTIYNIMGQEVIKLIDKDLTAGYKSIVWNGHDKNGNQVPSGVYVYLIKAGDFVKSHKMLMMK